MDFLSLNKAIKSLEILLHRRKNCVTNRVHAKEEEKYIQSSERIHLQEAWFADQIKNNNFPRK